MEILRNLTKAKMLTFLSKKVKSFNVLPIYIVTRNDFIQNKEKIWNDIKFFFSNNNIIIRSSAANEDTLESSSAGKFLSVPDVNKNNYTDVVTAIEKVINSYDSSDNNDEVLIQPYLVNVSIAGVAFTSDIDTLAPYYIINYDDSGSCNNVTSGNFNNLKTYIHLKNHPLSHTNIFIEKILKASFECEKLLNNKHLDIEFAIDNEGVLYILQVRPIVVKNKNKLINDIAFSNYLRKVYKKIEKLRLPHPHISGKTTIFGVMPDWNPAEIIGLKPRRLALSLYKELITDRIWAYQRDNYGYKNLRSFPLLITFLGLPYIDVRVSFNSLIPKILNENISNKLADYYLYKLANTPKKHDKVEFDIVFSCYYFGITEKLNKLSLFDFSEKEIKNIEFCLLDLTNKIINPYKGIFKKDIKKILFLKNNHNDIVNSNMPLIDKIYWLIENCKRYGTLPFAGIARSAFISVQFLKSFIDVSIMTKNDYDSFMNSINTVSKQFNIDYIKFTNNKTSKDEFLEKYGHLRPGTYDICSERYDENFDLYFGNHIKQDLKEISETPYVFTSEQMKLIDHLLKDNNINISADDLIGFIRQSIEWREYSKFIFTKTLSYILVLIENLGKKCDISRSDMSYVDIQTIINLYSTLDHRDLSDILKYDINKNKDYYKITKLVKFPQLIVNPDDIYSFHLEEGEPNFITLKKAKGYVVYEENINSTVLENKILFIQSADPGFDWIFSKNIKGLITVFGGANSHMAIRCAELGLPAVIGCGEQNYKLWSRSKKLEIDAVNKKVTIIS